MRSFPLSYTDLIYENLHKMQTAQRKKKYGKLYKNTWDGEGVGDKSILQEPYLTLSNFDTFAQNIDCGYTLEPRRF